MFIQHVGYVFSNEIKHTDRFYIVLKRFLVYQILLWHASRARRARHVTHNGVVCDASRARRAKRVGPVPQQAKDRSIETNSPLPNRTQLLTNARDATADEAQQHSARKRKPQRQAQRVWHIVVGSMEWTWKNTKGRTILHVSVSVSDQAESY